MSNRTSVALLLSWAALACGVEAPIPTAAQSAGSAPAVVCVEDPETLGPDDLRCEGTGTFECGVDGIELFVEPNELDASACGTSTLSLSDPAPGIGSRVVDVVETSSVGVMSTVCSSTVTVIDTTPPTVTERVVELWPPNHKLVHFGAEDCAKIADACDEGEDLDFRFVSVTVDEPANGRGDGNTAVDVVYDCDGLALRAERAGGDDGRVYRVVFEVEDQEGNVIGGTCFAEVPPNQSTTATEGAASYVVELEAPEDCGDGHRNDDDDDNDDRHHPGRGRPDRGVNTGPLPEGCSKIEGMDIGADGILVEFGMNSATIDAWFLKDDDASDFVDFDYTVTSTPAFVSVKAGGDIFSEVAVGTSTQAFRNPKGTGGPAAKGISNVVFCDCEDFDCGDDGGDGEGDAPDDGSGEGSGDDTGDDDGGIDPGGL